MGLWKDLKSGFDLMLKPGENSKKSLNVGAAYTWYYKVTLIPLIALIVVALLLVSSFGTSPIVRVLGSAFFGLGVLTAVVLPIVFVWLLIPISILVSAGLVHIVGVWTGQFKGDLSKTLTATMFGRIPSTIFLFALIIPSSFVLYFVFAIWALVVYVIALQNQQKVSWPVALGVILITTIVVAAVIGLIATVFAVQVNNAILNALLPHLIGNNGYTVPTSGNGMPVITQTTP